MNQSPVLNGLAFEYLYILAFMITLVWSKNQSTSNDIGPGVARKLQTGLPK